MATQAESRTEWFQTARQLSGFGISDAALVQSPGDVLPTPDAEFEVIVYPSDVHLWEGLVL